MTRQCEQQQELQQEFWGRWGGSLSCNIDCEAVALPALQADGREGQEELFAETNKVFDIGKGAIEMEVNKVNERLNEIGGVFVLSSVPDHAA
eukprot:1249337-Amphidinium_carterae.1